MNILTPYKKFDILYYYNKISQNKKVQTFLKNKPLASKIWIPNITFFIRRGSKDQVLFIQELSKKELNESFFEIRAKVKREDAIKNKKVTKLQEKIWLYFPPNKCINFFYACNGEGQGKKIDRIFIDIDKSNLSSEKAQQVTKELIKIIKQDKEFNKLIKYRIVILWTGASFHVYLMLKKQVSIEFYHKYISYTKQDPCASFIGRWAKEITNKTKIKVIGGHENKKNTIVLDPSQTPSGKLARVPFSLHFKKPAKNQDSIDGICLPINTKMLEDKNLVKKLKSLMPEKVLQDINKWAENL